MNDEIKKNVYLGVRYIEIICIAIFIFGFLWEGTELLQLSLPEFMMLYGGTGAILTETLSRILYKQVKKKTKITTGGETKDI